MTQRNWGDLVKDAAPAGFQLIPDGDYEFKILEATFKIASTGKPMFALKNEIQEGAYAKRIIFDNLVIDEEDSSKNVYFFRKTAAIGLPKEFFTSTTSDADIAAALTGRSFKGTVGKGKPFAGEEKNAIKAYKPSTRQVSAPSAPPFVPGAPTPQPAFTSSPAPVPQQEVQAPVQQAPIAPPAPTPNPWDNVPPAAPEAPLPF